VIAGVVSKEETVPHGMIHRLIDIGRYYGMEINVEKNKGDENLRAAVLSVYYDR
jgi:hypothetical protein